MNAPQFWRTSLTPYNPFVTSEGMSQHLAGKFPVKILKFGKYTLQYPEEHKKKKPIHQEAMKQLRNEESDSLDISWGKYKRFRWNKILKYIKKSDVQRILAYGNTDKHILLSISRVHFANLSMLDLRQCHIENIECLPSGPNLNYLSLTNNNIRSLSVLKKCELTNLKTLLLNDNPIAKLDIERCNFTLQTYWLERKYNTKTIQECLGQTNIFKLKFDKMNDISIESIDRIYQSKHIEKINAKFPKLIRLFFTDPEDYEQGQNQFFGHMTDSDEEALAAQNAADQQDESLQNIHEMHYIEGEEDDWNVQQDERYYQEQSNVSGDIDQQDIMEEGYESQF